MEQLIQKLTALFAKGGQSGIEIPFSKLVALIPEGYSFYLSDESEYWYVQEDKPKKGQEPILIIGGPRSTAVSESLGWTPKTIKDAGNNCIFRLLPPRENDSDDSVTLLLTIRKERKGTKVA